MKSTVIKLSAVAVAAALTACGGGSEPAPQPSITTVSGNAVKGPMDKAKVTVFRLNADGTVGAKLDDGLSGANGSFNVSFSSDYTGPILVEVEATDETIVQDEVLGPIKATGLKLRAVLQPPSGNGGTLSVQVNPLTEIAVADAVQKGGLTVARIEQANADIATKLGFNPQTDGPTFTLVDGKFKPVNNSAVVLAAISKLATTQSECKGAVSSGDKLKCIVEQVGKPGSTILGSTEFKSAIDNVAKDAGLVAPNLPVNNNNGGATPTPTPTPSPTPIETAPIAQAKELMASLRSNAKALSATDLSLQTKLNEVNAALKNTVEPVVESTFEMLRTMDFGVQMLEDAKNGSKVYRGNRSGTPYAAGCTLYTDSTFVTPAGVDVAPVTVGCSSYLLVNRNVFDTTTGSNNTWRWRHRLLISPKAGAPGTYEVKTQARREYGTCEFQTGNCGTFTYTFPGTANQAKPVTTVSYPNNSGYSVQRGEEGTAEFMRTLSAGSVTALTLTGSTAPSMVYAGFNVSPVLENGNGRRHEVDLAVAKVTEGNVQKLVLSKDAFIKFFSRDAVDGPAVFRSSIGIGKDSYVQAPMTTDAKDGTEAFKLSIGYVAGNSALRGSLEATTALWDKSRTSYVPTKVLFGGRLETRETPSSDWVDFLRGSFALEAVNFAGFDSRLPRSNSNPQTLKATLNAVVTVPTRPALIVKDLMVVNTDKGLNNNTSTFSGQYVQGTLVINVNGTTAGSAADKVALESATGIKLDYDASKTVHPMSKSGIKVGDYNEKTQRIDYVDGTFEQY